MKMKKQLKIILTLAGLALFVMLIVRTDVSLILKQLGDFSWYFLPVTVLAFGWLLLQAMAWQTIQAALVTYSPLWLLFKVKVAGEALNMLLPTANLGGDTARAMMVKEHIPLDKGIPGVMADKTIEFMAGIFFIAGGLGYGLISLSLPGFLVLPGLVCLVVTTVALAVGIFLQVRGIFNSIQRLFSRLPFRFLHRFMEKNRETLRKLDLHLGKLYRNSRSMLLTALLLHIGSRMLKAVEVYLILRVMYIPVDFGDAFFFTAMTVVVNTIFFLLPGQWGVSEAAQVLLLQNIGVTAPAGMDLAAAGLSLAVIRRIRKLLFTLLGVVFFNWIPRVKNTFPEGDKRSSMGRQHAAAPVKTPLALGEPPEA
jgi:glycosyltransferase 2 family protein